MKRYREQKAKILKDEGGNMKAVEVTCLDFLRERKGYGYIERHALHFNHKKALRKMKSCEGCVVLVPSEKVASDVHKYYRVPKEAIVVNPEGFIS